MKKKTIKIGIVLIIVIVFIVLTYYLMPGIALKMTKIAGRGAAGLAEKHVQVDDHRIAYLEGGKGETILLVHGYAAEKDNWTPFARYLTGKYRVICPDLAGFGESSRLLKASYDIQSQVDRLNRFTEVLKLDRFHIVGNSMGGMISGVYGAEYPNKILSLALFAPGGIRSPVKSEFIKLMEKGSQPLLINSIDDYERILKLIFVKVPMIPYPVKKEMTMKAIENRAFNDKILKDMAKKPLFLEPFLPEIKAPTLILWGDADKFTHISSVPILEQDIKRHRTVIMKHCGHAPMLEKPQETADHYLRFLQETVKKTKESLK